MDNITISVDQGPDLSIKAAKDKYTGDPGETINIATTVTNDNAKGTEYNPTVGWRFKNENTWHESRMPLPAGTKPVSFAVPVTNANRIVQIGVNREVLTDVYSADPQAEVTTDNNFDEITVGPEDTCTDISVTISRVGTVPIYPGEYGALEVVLKRDNNGPNTAVPVRFTVIGPGHSIVHSMSLRRGETKKFKDGALATAVGTFTYVITAEPVGVPDCIPGNNKDSVNVRVDKMPDFPASSKKQWVELIS